MPESGDKLNRREFGEAAAAVVLAGGLAIGCDNNSALHPNDNPIITKDLEPSITTEEDRTSITLLLSEPQHKRIKQLTIEPGMVVATFADKTEQHFPLDKSKKEQCVDISTSSNVAAAARTISPVDIIIRHSNAEQKLLLRVNPGSGERHAKAAGGYATYTINVKDVNPCPLPVNGHSKSRVYIKLESDAPKTSIITADTADASAKPEPLKIARGLMEKKSHSMETLFLNNGAVQVAQFPTNRIEIDAPQTFQQR